MLKSSSEKMRGSNIGLIWVPEGKTEREVKAKSSVIKDWQFFRIEDIHDLTDWRSTLSPKQDK